MNICLGLTGSVATTIANNLLLQLFVQGHKVKIVTTRSAEMFQNEESFYPTLSDKDEEHEYAKNQKVLHIELVKWADVFLIAPCSANTLAKISNGICDNLLTCVARAWDFDKQFIIAPAMNTRMWTHPITNDHLQKVRTYGIKTVDPISKTLYCGDTGIGAMAEIQTIMDKIDE